MWGGFFWKIFFFLPYPEVGLKNNVAFLPGSFDYHPKKGYNLGMSNNLESVTNHNQLIPNIGTYDGRNFGGTYCPGI